MTVVIPTNASDAPWDNPLWFRQVASEVTAMLLRLYGAHQLDLVEDAVQDAFVSAVRVWPQGGVPANPTGWLVHTARNRLRDAHRRRKHERDLELSEPQTASRDDLAFDASPLADDQVQLLFACCHPALSAESRVALTLKTVAQLSVEEIARALHADTRAVAQRLVRAKNTLRESRAEWRMPSPNELPERVDDVLSVCYAMFSEGHAATGGDAAVRVDLCNEAIRLLEFLVNWPDTATPDAHALLALCCFTAARVPARVSSAQGVDDWTSLADQDRRRWDRGLIMRGLRAFDRASSGTHLSRYHVEAESASLHSLAPSYAETPWLRIVAAYERLLHITPSRAAALAQAIAIAESGDLDAAWRSLQRLGKSVRVGEWPNWLVACAEIAERRGDIAAAITAYDGAIESSLPDPVRRHLAARRARLEAPGISG
jgi:RNA polymerase sigma-70 factor (ECF subfamily)